MAAGDWPSLAQLDLSSRSKHGSGPVKLGLGGWVGRMQDLWGPHSPLGIENKMASIIIMPLRRSKVRAHLNDCVFWYLHLRQDIAELDKMQKRATKRPEHLLYDAMAKAFGGV